jgi:hypothetical protein
MGTIAFVRQSFLDAQHQRLAEERYQKAKAAGAARPNFDPSARGAAAGARRQAAGRVRSQRGARDRARARPGAGVQADPIVTGGGEADQVTAELKARNAQVIYNLNYPTARGCCRRTPTSRSRR